MGIKNKKYKELLTRILRMIIIYSPCFQIDSRNSISKMFHGLDRITLKRVFLFFQILIGKKIKKSMTLSYIRLKNKYKRWFDLEKMIEYASWNLNIFPDDRGITREDVIRRLIIRIAEDYFRHFKTKYGTIRNFMQYHEETYGCLYRGFTNVLLTSDDGE